MMGNIKPKFLGLATLTAALISTSALAGGFDRGGVNIDQLFDTDRFSAQAKATYVNPQRKIHSANRPGLPANSSIDVDSNFWVPSVGFKMNLAEGLDCLGTYSEGYGANAAYGTGNIYSPSTVEFSIDTTDYGLTCAYQMGLGSTSVGDSFLRIIAGGSYQELDGFQSRQSLLFGNATLGVPAGVITGLGKFNIGGEAWGWRAGMAYEIPDIALRASIVYSSKYDYDDLSGTQDNTGFGAPAVIAGLGGATVPIFASAEIPQALDIKFQSGIREGTLAFVNFKWQDWSKLDIIEITGSPSTLAFEPGYKDGYTITAGIGQVLTENLSGLISLTWDDGTSTVSGTQTDTWTLSGGIRYKEGEQIEINLGGAIGVMEGGSSRALPNSIDTSNSITYKFDADLLLAGSASMKYKF